MHSPSYYNLTVKIIISKHNQEVVGSSPTGPTKLNSHDKSYFEKLAELDTAHELGL